MIVMKMKSAQVETVSVAMSAAMIGVVMVILSASIAIVNCNEEYDGGGVCDYGECVCGDNDYGDNEVCMANASVPTRAGVMLIAQVSVGAT